MKADLAFWLRATALILGLVLAIALLLVAAFGLDGAAMLFALFLYALGFR